MTPDLPPPPALFLHQAPTAAPDEPATRALEVAHPAPAQRLGVHGMLLFGANGAFYASHVPMFHPPHDAQLLLSVTFDRVALETANRACAEELCSLEPERMDLDEVLSGKRTTFTAALHRGNFEQSPDPIAQGVQVTVRKRLWTQPLSEKTAHTAALEYRVVGAGKDAYLLHVISSPPDFDQLLRVTLPKGARGERFVVRGRVNHPAKRLEQSERVAGLLDGKPVTLTVERELSYLVGPEFTPYPASRPPSDK